MMAPGERQVAPTLDGIRADHVNRYKWAAKRLRELRAEHVIDLACGVGYGTQILAEAGCYVWGHDRDQRAIEYARQHYAHERALFAVADAADKISGIRDAVVCFETIEHLEDPRPMLRALHGSGASYLLASVPNETVFPYRNYAFHFRHYRKREFESLLRECGWRVTEWHGQEGDQSEVEPNVNGRTIIAVAERTQIPTEPESDLAAIKAVYREGAKWTTADTLAGKHIAIVGLGPSATEYLRITRGHGGRHKFCDETWTINALGDVFACDRVFHMDDVRIQEIRAKALPDSNIAAMLSWMKTHPGPIITSRAHPDYPGLVEFPFEDVVNDCPFGYFNGTAAYAVAYAIYRKVGKISLFGCDFTYPNAHDAEKGRACVEFWLGFAAERGIKLSVPKTTSLLDACHTQAERFYGFDTRDIVIKRVGERIKIEFTERTELPSAEELEARYDHEVHPSPLMKGQ
jgi:SAM-dependent methyltransferase